MDINLNNILLVDDDASLCDLLIEFLSAEGFKVDSVNDGQSAINLLTSSHTFDAVVLDIMMPGINGLEVLQTVRKVSEVPILMLTGKGDDIDRILGLEMGADDYLGKPCNPRELAARIKAVLRRVKPQPSAMPQNVVNRNGISINPGTLEAAVNGQALNLTSAEFNVLKLLLESAGQVLTKEYLTEEVLHRKLTAYDRSIDVHVSRIRQKLAEFGDMKNLIKSVRGVGYQMVSQSKHETKPS